MVNEGGFKAKLGGFSISTVSYKGGIMTDNLRVLERGQVALNYMDDHSTTWPDWKTKIALNKLDCLMRIMETRDRRIASHLS